MPVALRTIAAALALCACAAGYAQPYPNKALRIIIPFPGAGGAADVTGRLAGQKLSEALGQPVVIDNRPGAGGNIAAETTARAAPDGYTLFQFNIANTMAPALYKKLAYDPQRDFAPVTQIGSTPFILCVHPSVPAKSVAELIAYAKARPGTLNFGSSGTGSLNQLAAEWFAMSAGIKMIHVPYRGGGAGVIDLMSGQISLYFMNALQSLPYIKSGRLRALGVTTPQRSPFAPEIPAIAESGLPGYDMTTWTALLVTGGTPREVVNKLHAEVALILNQPETKERLAADGMAVVASTPAQFTDFLARESSKYARIIQAAGITAAQ